MIHHVSVGSTDIQRSRAFYDPLMLLIGFRLIKVSDTSLHYGAADIAFSIGVPLDGRPASPGNGVHIAFQTPDRETVRQFHQIALANGGADEGAQGHSRKLQCQLLWRLRSRSRWKQDRSCDVHGKGELLAAL